MDAPSSACTALSRAAYGRRPWRLKPLTGLCTQRACYHANESAPVEGAEHHLAVKGVSRPQVEGGR